MSDMRNRVQAVQAAEDGGDVLLGGLG